MKILRNDWCPLVTSIFYIVCPYPISIVYMIMFTPPPKIVSVKHYSRVVF